MSPRKSKRKRGEANTDDLPRLPKLPSPEEESSDYYDSDDLPKLPKYPSTDFGDKMSQSSIKEAVSGGEEDDEEADADEFVQERTTHEPHGDYQRGFGPDFDEEEIPTSPSPKGGIMQSKSKQKKYSQGSQGSSKEERPVFIRIDKYEESLETFEDAKKRIKEMEDLLNDIKEVREKESRELAHWEKEVQSLKNQVGKIESDVFSKS